VPGTGNRCPEVVAFLEESLRGGDEQSIVEGLDDSNGEIEAGFALQATIGESVESVPSTDPEVSLGIGGDIEEGAVDEAGLDGEKFSLGSLGKSASRRDPEGSGGVEGHRAEIVEFRLLGLKEGIAIFLLKGGIENRLARGGDLRTCGTDEEEQENEAWHEDVSQIGGD